MIPDVTHEMALAGARRHVEMLAKLDRRRGLAVPDDASLNDFSPELRNDSVIAMHESIKAALAAAPPAPEPDEAERARRLLYCVGTGLSLACEGAVPVNVLQQLWIDPHGLRADIAHCLGADPLQVPEGAEMKNALVDKSVAELQELRGLIDAILERKLLGDPRIRVTVEPDEAMVERVARAMEPELWSVTDGFTAAAATHARLESMHKARAAIAAMKEPK